MSVPSQNAGVMTTSGFQSNSLEAVGGFFSAANNASGSRASFTSRTILPRSSTMQTLLLDRNIQSTKVVHAALLLLMLETVHTDLVSP